MRRSLTSLILVALIACSAGTTPAARGTSSASLGATAAGATSSTTTAAASPSAAASRTETATPTLAPPAAPPGKAPQDAPPQPGTYTYAQQGSTEFGGSTFPAEKSGTLSVARATIASDGQRQHQTRTYGSDHTSEQDLVFRTSGIYLARAIEHFGPAGFQQSVTCAPAEPMLLIGLPLTVGAKWNASSACSGERIAIDGSVAREENRTVGATSVRTFVVNITVTLTGSGYSATSHDVEWVSPAYRLIVHSTENTEGSYGNARFTRTLTEDLTGLTPR